MRKQFVENKNLNEFGNRLLKKTGLRNDEIESIISKPNLYNTIAAQIKKEKAQREANKIPPNFIIASNLHWRKITLSFTALLIFILFISSLFYLKKNESAQNFQVENSFSPKEYQIISPAEKNFAPKADIENPAKSYQTVKYEKRAEKKFLTENKIKNSPQKLIRKNLKQALVDNNQEIFYPLAFAGDLYVGDDSKQIVQAEVSSEDLIKLGLTLPIEDRNEVFKTEMIVGSGGTPLAVKFVKNF